MAGANEERRQLEDRLIAAFHGILQAMHRIGAGAGFPAERLTMPQFRVLALATQVRTSGELARHLRLSAPTLTGIVDRLVEGGYVERRRGRADRRVVEIVPTERGRQALADVMAARDEQMRRYFAAMAVDDAQALLRGLEAFRSAILAQGTRAVNRPGPAGSAGQQGPVVSAESREDGI